MTSRFEISVNMIVGRADSDDIDRARAAAVAELDAAGVSAGDAYAEFQRQWEYLGSDEAEAAGLAQDYDGLTGLAAIWVRAEKAADIALTAGWADPNGASCGISA
jgi:hypothetical protein